MDKKVKKTIHHFRHIPTWVFLLLFIASATVSVYSLRHNNETMVKLREAVYAADKNNGDVSGSLNNLRRYVYGHMNTNLSSGGNAIKPPIQLKYTYERLQAEEQKKAASNNTQVYTDAQAYCQAQNSTDFSGRNRVPCVQDYVTTHGGQAVSIPAALYQFDFISPTWSPDIAGWSLVLTIILLFLLLASFTVDILVKIRIKHMQ